MSTKADAALVAPGWTDRLASWLKDGADTRETPSRTAAVLAAILCAGLWCVGWWAVLGALLVAVVVKSWREPQLRTELLLCAYMLACLIVAGWAFLAGQMLVFLGALVADIALPEWLDRHNRAARRREFWRGAR